MFDEPFEKEVRKIIEFLKVFIIKKIFFYIIFLIKNKTQNMENNTQIIIVSGISL